MVADADGANAHKISGDLALIIDPANNATLVAGRHPARLRSVPRGVRRAVRGQRRRLRRARPRRPRRLRPFEPGMVAVGRLDRLLGMDRHGRPGASASCGPTAAASMPFAPRRVPASAFGGSQLVGPGPSRTVLSTPSACGTRWPRGRSASVMRIATHGRRRAASRRSLSRRAGSVERVDRGMVAGRVPDRVPPRAPRSRSCMLTVLAGGSSTTSWSTGPISWSPDGELGAGDVHARAPRSTAIDGVDDRAAGDRVPLDGADGGRLRSVAAGIARSVPCRGAGRSVPTTCALTVPSFWR